MVTVDCSQPLYFLDVKKANKKRERFSTSSEFLPLLSHCIVIATTSFDASKLSIIVFLLIFKRQNTGKSLHHQANVPYLRLGCCQGDDSFVAFQPMGIFRCWQNGELTCSQRWWLPSIFPLPYPLTLAHTWLTFLGQENREAVNSLH